MRSTTFRVTGHFGEWLQGRLGMNGPVVLVTLPCKALTVTVQRAGDGAFSLGQSHPAVIDPGQAAAMIRELGQGASGQFDIAADMPPGGGAGASTAGLVALAQALGVTDPQRIAKACIAAEGASDPLMFDHPDRMLWASRQGHSLSDLPTLPSFEIVGGFLGPPQRTDPSEHDFPDIGDLVQDWAPAAARQDRERLAQLASESAQRTTVLRGPTDDETASLARHWSALGHIRAHTGSARGLVFAPGHVPVGLAAQLSDRGYRHVFQFSTG